MSTHSVSHRLAIAVFQFACALLLVGVISERKVAGVPSPPDCTDEKHYDISLHHLDQLFSFKADYEAGNVRLVPKPKPVEVAPKRKSRISLGFRSRNKHQEETPAEPTPVDDSPRDLKYCRGQNPLNDYITDIRLRFYFTETVKFSWESESSLKRFSMGDDHEQAKIHSGNVTLTKLGARELLVHNENNRVDPPSHKYVVYPVVPCCGGDGVAGLFYGGQGKMANKEGVKELDSDGHEIAYTAEGSGREFFFAEAAFEAKGN